MAARAPELAVVSHGLPEAGGRSEAGYPIILDELVAPLPQDLLVYVGIGRDGPSEADVVRLPWFRRPSRRSESAVAAVSTLASATLGARWLAARYPRVRRILALVDPTLPIAVRWAELAGAELWLYAIDLHAESFWNAPEPFTSRLARWKRRACARADRAFALSPGLAVWLEAQGVRCPIELLPPLIRVGAPVPLRASRPVKFVYVGAVYRANARPLGWLEKAAAAAGGAAELTLLTTQTPESLAGQIDLSRWRLSRGSREEVVAAVQESTWPVIALDPDPRADWRLPFCWPTKLREYLAVGRPVFCIAGRDYDIARLARESGWGLVATDERETVDAMARALSEGSEALTRRAAAAHAFARERMDNATIGEAFRARMLAPASSASRTAANANAGPMAGNER
jgi:hypothetical protein